MPPTIMRARPPRPLGRWSLRAPARGARVQFAVRRPPPGARRPGGRRRRRRGPSPRRARPCSRSSAAATRRTRRGPSRGPTARRGRPAAACADPGLARAAAARAASSAAATSAWYFAAMTGLLAAAAGRSSARPAVRRRGLAHRRGRCRDPLPVGDSPACLTSEDELSYRCGSPVSAKIAAAPTEPV